MRQAKEFSIVSVAQLDRSALVPWEWKLTLDISWSPSLHCELVSKVQAEEQNIRDALASVNGEARPALRITLQQIER